MTLKMKSVAAEINAVGPDDAFPGQFEVVLSTPALDRDGDTLKSDGWVTPLPTKIQFNTDHSMLVEHTAGSGVPTIENGNLVVRGTYASTEHAQATRKLVSEGHIDSVSVTYREMKGGMRELINGAFVVVPSNPEAKVLASKAMGGGDDDEDDDDAAVAWLKNVEGKSLSDMALMIAAAGGITHNKAAGMVDVGNGVLAPAQLVQAIHDASNNLGAACIPIGDAVNGDGTWSFLSGEDGTCTASLELDGKVYSKQIPADMLGVKGDSPTPTDVDPSEKDRSKSAAELVKLKARAFALGQHETV